MKDVKLVVRISKPISEVFDFTITPAHTPLWIDSIVKEQIEGDGVGIGTRYINESRDGNINTYIVSQFRKNEVFELKSIPSGYTVRYTYTRISDSETELEYFEWVDEGELESPFEQRHMDKLKTILETK